MRRIILFLMLFSFGLPAVAQVYWPKDSEVIDGMNLSMVQSMFETAFQGLHERSLEPVSPGALVEEALSSFERFLPGIKIKVAGNRVLLSIRGNVVGNFPSPEDPNDMRAWSRLMAVIILNIRHHDPELLSAHPEQLYYLVFTKLASVIDPYAKYLYPKQSMGRAGSAALANTSIGISYRRTKAGLQILSVFEQSPAFLQGLAEGDVITHINNKDVTKMFDEEIETTFHGRTNTMVSLTYRDYINGLPKEVTLRRTSFIPSVIDLKILNNKAMIIVHNMTLNTKTLVQEAIIHAYNENEELDGVILDLRGNSGGLLSQGVELADMFLDAGTICTTRGRHADANQVYKATPGDLLNGRPMVVLIDQTTASSAELLAMALQENGRAVIVGSPSKGKGTVQTSVTLPNQAQLIFSWARVFSGEEQFLDKRGVLPIVCTSSVGTLKDAQKMLANIQRGDFNVPIAKWRTLPATQMDEIAKIRQACAPSKHDEDFMSFTVTLAEAILDDEKAYQTLLEKTLVVPEEEQ